MDAFIFHSITAMKYLQKTASCNAVGDLKSEEKHHYLDITKIPDEI